MSDFNGTNGVSDSSVVENTNKDTAQAVAQAVLRTVEDAVEGARDRTTGNISVKVKNLQKVVKALEGDIWMLVYDIPDVLKDQVGNPSRVFWRHGYRLNYSCWVMPARGLQSKAVQDELAFWESVPAVDVPSTIPGYTRQARVRHYAVKYAADQLTTIRKIAQEKLEEELIRIHTSLITRLGAADDRLRVAEAALAERERENLLEVTDQERQALIARRNNDVRKTLREAQECFVGALESARAFDATDDLETLFTGVRQAIRAESLAFNAAMELIQRRGVEMAPEIAPQEEAA